MECVCAECVRFCSFFVGDYGGVGCDKAGSDSEMVVCEPCSFDSEAASAGCAVGVLLIDVVNADWYVHSEVQADEMGLVVGGKGVCGLQVGVSFVGKEVSGEPIGDFG